MAQSMTDLAERLFKLLTLPRFLNMEGLANEVPIFIQTYDPGQEDALRATVAALLNRLRSTGLSVASVDLFELVLEELEEASLLEDFVAGEATYEPEERLETLQNYSDPTEHLIPRLIRRIGDEAVQLTLVTGSGRIYPFLRTHSILESLQPAMLRHPVILLFPGEYLQDVNGGSHLRLFGTIPAPVINNPYYRATNLDRYTL